MKKIKVAYICHFSTQKVRGKLPLKSLAMGNCMRRLIGIKPLCYEDTGTWNEIFIKTFENNYDFDCYVITNFMGLKKKEHGFQMESVNYVFIQEKEHLFNKVFRKITRRKAKEDYSSLSYRINNVINRINPDIVVLCGAENATYATSVLSIENKPLFVILQTLLNSPKRILMGVGNEFRRNLEKSIIKHANYFGTNNLEEVDYIKRINNNAICLEQSFPSVTPDVIGGTTKQFDFVFFANELTKNKGIEDVILGFGLVHKKIPNSSLIVIGSYDEHYLHHLKRLIAGLGIKDNIIFCGHYQLKSDMLHQVMKAKIAVLPGITAAMNSTVRESMFMGIPVVMYETSATKLVNKDGISLLTAEMEDYKGLGRQMLYALEHPDEVKNMAEKARKYAEDNFSVEAIKAKLEENIKAIVNHYYNNYPISRGLV